MFREKTFCLFDLIHPENNICLKLNECQDESRIISELGAALADDVDENDTFSSALLGYMRKRHLSTKDLYDRAYIDRRHFHKIIRNSKYHPSKKTVLALCVALELNYADSLDLLSHAGYAFATNSRSDRIYRYFLTKRIYDIDLINSVLYHFHCPCIGD